MLIIDQSRKSKSYIGTIDPFDKSDEQWLKGVRKIVSEANKHMRDSDNGKQLYVKLSGVNPTDVYIYNR